MAEDMEKKVNIIPSLIYLCLVLGYWNYIFSLFLSIFVSLIYTCYISSLGFVWSN